jgi:hypothetical protein
MNKPVAENAKSAASSRYRRVRRLALLLASVVLGSALVLATISHGIIGVLAFLGLVVVVGVAFFVLCVAIALVVWVLLLPVWIVHELGHAVAALAVGWRVVQFHVRPVVLVRHEGRFRLGLRWSSALPIGYVFAHPTTVQTSLRPMALYLAGGILANLFATGLCVAVILLPLLTATPPRLSLTTFLLAGQAVLNLVYVVINLFPSTSAGTPTDGKQLLGLIALSRAQRWELFFIRPGLGGALFNGVRPRDWNLEFLERLRSRSSDPAEQANAALCAYHRALDRGEVERAGQLLELALAWVGDGRGSDRSAILAEAAYFSSFHRHEAGEARRWLHQVNVRELEEHTFLRAAAAVLLAEGLFTEAANSAQKALRRLKRSLDPGGAAAERDWLQAIIEECCDRFGPEVSWERFN